MASRHKTYASGQVLGALQGPQQLGARAKRGLSFLGDVRLPVEIRSRVGLVSYLLWVLFTEDLGRDGESVDCMATAEEASPVLPTSQSKPSGSIFQCL